jgi:hypothetical protein
LEEIELQAKGRPPSPDLYRLNLTLSSTKPRLEAVLADLAMMRRAATAFVVMLGISLLAIFTVPTTNFLASQLILMKNGHLLVGSVLNSNDRELVTG